MSCMSDPCLSVILAIKEGDYAAHRLWQFQLFSQQEGLCNEFPLLERFIGLIDSLDGWAKAIQHFLYLVMR